MNFSQLVGTILPGIQHRAALELQELERLGQGVQAHAVTQSGDILQPFTLVQLGEITTYDDLFDSFDGLIHFFLSLIIKARVTNPFLAGTVLAG